MHALDADRVDVAVQEHRRVVGPPPDERDDIRARAGNFLNLGVKSKPAQVTADKTGNLLLAGPALSLPSMLVIRSYIGTQKTIVYCSLVVVMATITGMIPFRNATIDLFMVTSLLSNTF